MGTMERENRALKIRADDCIRDGWILFRKNIAAIVLFSVLVCGATVVRSWLLPWLRVALGGGMGDLLTPQNVAGALALLGGTVEPAPPPFPQNAVLLVCDLLTQYAVALVSYCGTVWVAANSLRILRHGEELPEAREMIRRNAGRLFRIWLLIQSVTLFATRIWDVPALMAGRIADWPTSTQLILVLGMMGLMIFLLILAVPLVFIQQYAVCYALCGRGEGAIRQSRRMGRRTAGTIAKMFLLYTGMIVLLAIAFQALPLGGFSLAGLPNPLATAIFFFWVTAQIALFHRADRNAPAGEEEGEEREEQKELEELEELEEPLAPSLLQEIAAAEAIGERIRARVPPSLRFDDVGEFRCGLARVREGGKYTTGKWGYVDTNGRQVIPFAYQTAADFSDGLAVVSEGSAEFFLDREGARRIDASFDRADAFRDGLALVKKGPDWGFLSPDGGVRYLPNRDVYAFSEGLAVANDGGKWVYLDASMKPVLRTEYDDVWSFSGGLAMVEKDGKLGYIDRAGTEVVPPRYAGAKSFSEGLAAVAVAVGKALRWGYIDQSGQEIIAPQFERAGTFRTGRAAVCVDEKYGHIDRTGAFITPPEYQAAGSFRDGCAVVEEAAFGYVDTEGAECVAPVYLDARPFSEGLAWVRTAEGWGILEICEREGEDCVCAPPN